PEKLRRPTSSLRRRPDSSHLRTWCAASRSGSRPTPGRLSLESCPIRTVQLSLILRANSFSARFSPESSARSRVYTSTRLCIRALQKRLVDETPTPALARFDRGDDRMCRRVEVLPCVTVLGAVATAHVAARAAKAQVHPRVADREAFFTAVRIRSIRFDRIEMCATSAHGFLGRRTVNVLPFPSPALYASTVP